MNCSVFIANDRTEFVSVPTKAARRNSSANGFSRSPPLCAVVFIRPAHAELHREPAGRFRATIETAFYALRARRRTKIRRRPHIGKRRRLLSRSTTTGSFYPRCARADEPCRHFLITRVSDHADWHPAGTGHWDRGLAPLNTQWHRRPTPMKTERMRTATFAQMDRWPGAACWLGRAPCSPTCSCDHPDKVPQGWNVCIRSFAGCRRPQ